MESQLHRLRDALPEGVPVPFVWLKTLGISSSLVTHYLDSGWLQRLPGGAYWRLTGELEWRAALYSAQQLGLNVHAGELTALHSLGLGHYQSLQSQVVQVYLPGRPPRWLSGLPLNWQWHHGQLFEETAPALPALPTSLRTPAPNPPVASLLGLEVTGDFPYPVYQSTAERAAIELAAGLTTGGSWDTAYETFSGLTMLRPELLRTLLLACKKVVVKRIFLHLAASSHHAWLKHLDLTGIDLGTGDRQVVAGGQLDPVYRITVPKKEDYGEF